MIFDDDSIAEGEELNMGDQVYLTRPDNFNQLRALLYRLLAAAPQHLKGLSHRPAGDQTPS